VADARIGVAFVASLLALPRPAPASEPQSITLSEALRVAEERSAELQGARERAAAQAARSEAIRRLAWPRLSASLVFSHTDNPAAVFANKLNAGALTQQDFALDRLNAPSALSHLTSALTLAAPIDLAGRVQDQAGAQAAAGRVLDATAREVLLDLRLRVIESYHRASLAEYAVDVAERARGAALAREADLVARVEAGKALEADRLRARARRRERDAELAERRGAREVALAALARALGVPPEQRVAPSDAIPAPAPLADPEAAWVERALRQRPALAAAHDRLAAAEQGRHAEGRALWPELFGFAQLQDDRNASGSAQSGSAGVALRWSFLDAGRGRRVAAAAAEERAAQQDERAAADDLRLGVIVAFRRAEAARERHAAAAGGSAEGQEALRVVHERRLAGLATLTDELETEAASLAAELRELQAAADVALADAALKRAAGEI
jgi:outer membrane protein TolC